MKVLCEVCKTEFEAQRSTARFCGGTCRKRGRRQRQQSAQEPSPAGITGGRRAKRPLVEAVRKELTKARRLDTVDGQIAMLLAEQTAVATGAAAATLTKSLRVAVDRALEGSEQPARGRRAKPERDEVSKARERREQKAREAASRA